MKRAMKILIVICLALALLAGMSSGIAAATAESVWVNGMELIDGDYLAANDSTTVTAGATEEPATYVAWYSDGTLMLNDADIYNGSPFVIESNSGNCGICADGDVDIILCGENRILKEVDVFMAGIAVNGNVTVLSLDEGQLTVYGKKAGVYSNNGNLTIGGNAAIIATADGWTSDDYGYGAIYAMDGDVIIQDYASVESEFGENAVYDSPTAGICSYNGNVCISGDVSYFMEDTHAPFDSFGIYSGPMASETSGNLVIDDGACVSMDSACLGVGVTQSITIGKNAALVILDALYGIIWSQTIDIDGGTLQIDNPYANPFMGNPTITLNDSSLVAAAYTDVNGQLVEAQDLSKVAYSNAAGEYVYDNVQDNYIRYLLYRPSYEYETFGDCGKWTWSAPYIGFVIENGIMGSVYSGSDYFDANGTVTRGMVVTVMYRLLGSPELSQADYDAYNNKFTDVEQGKWYYDAIVWAYNNDITSGMTDTSFAPERDVSREQMVTFAYRFCNTIGGNSMGGATLTRFSDKDQISFYALEAFQWAFEQGIVSGTSSTTLSPKSYCSREQMAKIITIFARSFMVDAGWIIPVGLE